LLKKSKLIAASRSFMQIISNVSFMRKQLQNTLWFNQWQT